MSPIRPKIVPFHPSLDLLAYGRRLCQHLGPGYDARAGDPASGAVHLTTPQRGDIKLTRSGGELTFVADGWPEVSELGLRRTFRKDILAHVSVQRDIVAAAHDVLRRVVEPYHAALAEAREREAAWRGVLKEIGECLALSGLRTDEVHAVGRTLQASRPLGVLDEAWAFVPSQTTTRISVQERGALGSFEAHYLSLQELAQINRFVDELIARRRPALRLHA